MALSAGKKLMYSLGQFGLVLSSYGVLKLFSVFYVTQKDSPYPVFIWQGYLFGLFTVAGLIIALGRLFDAGAGVLLGWASDRNLMKKGRRTGFMSAAALPLAFFSVLVFFPPTAESYVFNTISVLIVSVLFFFFLSLYTAPYLALLSEIGSGTRDRTQLSTLMACATAFASLSGNFAFSSLDPIMSLTGFTRAGAFRLVAACFGVVSAVCLALPAFLIKEKAFSDAEPVQDSLGESFRIVLKDSYFRHYLIADAMYRIAAAFTITGFSYYVTVLLGLPGSLISFYMLLIFFANLALYIPVCVLTCIVGKRKMLFSAFLMLMVFLVAASFAGRYPFESHAQGIFLSLLVSLPIAIFTVVPNALIADLAVANRRKTDQLRGGMYFGVHSIVSKAGQLVAALLFPTIVSIDSTRVSGSQGSGMTGIRLTLIIAAVISFVGFLFLFGYREKEVTVLLEKE